MPFSHSVDILILFQLFHKLLAHPCRSPAISAWFFTLRDALILILEEWVLKCLSVLLAHLLFSALTHRIPHSRSLKKSKFALLKSLLPYFFCVRPWTHCHSIQGCPSLYIPKQSFLVFRNKVQQFTSLHWLLHHLCHKVTFHTLQKHPSLCVCLVVLLFQQVTGWLKSPKRTSVCDRGYFQLAAEGLISFFPLISLASSKHPQRCNLPPQISGKIPFHSHRQHLELQVHTHLRTKTVFLIWCFDPNLEFVWLNQWASQLISHPTSLSWSPGKPDRCVLWPEPISVQFCRAIMVSFVSVRCENSIAQNLLFSQHSFQWLWREVSKCIEIIPTVLGHIHLKRLTHDKVAGQPEIYPIKISAQSFFLFVCLF